MLTIRRVRYGMVALAVVVVAYFAWQARGALVPFLIGGVLAYLLTPLVDRLTAALPFHRRRYELARTLAIFIVYLAGASVLVSAGALIIPALIAEVSQFVDNIPEYVEQSRRESERWTRIYQERVPAEIQQRVQAYAQEAGASLGALGQEILSRTFGIVRGAFSVVLGYVVIPFWLFYILKDRHKIGPAIRNWFPPGLHKDVDACFRICQRVLGSYIRAQLTLGLFIGVATTIGLWLLGVQFYVVLGLIAGITELIPIIGPILGAVPALIVVLATDPDKVLWVLLFYIAVQQVENSVLVPRIQGNAVDLHPAMIIVLLVVAQQVAGFLGMLVAVPLAAVAKDLFKYIYRRLQEQEREQARPRVLRLERKAPSSDPSPPPVSGERGETVGRRGSGPPSSASAGERAEGTQPSEQRGGRMLPAPAGAGEGPGEGGSSTPGEASP